ncbi:MAG: hypothetical protein JSV91_10605 [Phycisphaerales bacterium]|nr:MAG: hypothetical protein JSV91_10605 [Phycisphaerales bacterium]
MPANRSRTVGWRRCLRQIKERNGAVEIALARNYQEAEQGHHLVWRVHLLDVRDDAILIEQPAALGKTIPLQPGAALVVIISIGQNRWMFPTTHGGMTPHRAGDSRTVEAIRLPLPTNVQRCQRRTHYRVETASLYLPEVEVWPLLDPKSVLVAERANELEFESAVRAASGEAPPSDPLADSDDLMPEVGPKFAATLLNIGGGGVGIRVRPDAGGALSRHKLFWLRIALPPELITPICASAQLVHTHLESTQDTYAGLAFDFSFNPAHQRFVADQICSYIALQQKAMLADEVDETRQRRTA